MPLTDGMSAYNSPASTSPLIRASAAAMRSDASIEIRTRRITFLARLFFESSIRRPRAFKPAFTYLRHAFLRRHLRPFPVRLPLRFRRLRRRLCVQVAADGIDTLLSAHLHPFAASVFFF